MDKNSVITDVNGVVYKFPERKCTDCKKYPCLVGNKFKCDFAKYGCKDYINK